MPIPMRDSSNSEASPSMTCSPPGPKQRRISTACDVCRKKKIRCDGGRPRCLSCCSYGTTCTYSGEAKAKARGKGQIYIETLENRMARMESLMKNLVPGYGKPGCDSFPSKFSMDLSSDGSDIDPAEQVSGLAEGMGTLFVDHVGDTQYLGPSSGFSVLAKSLSNYTELTDQLQIAPFDGGIDAARPSASREVVQRYIDAYFENETLPILHRPSFEEWVQRVYTNDPPKEKCWWACWNMVLAIGSHFVDPKDKPLKETFGWAHFEKAYARLPDLLQGSNLRSLQALLLIIGYLQSTLKASRWVLMGSAVQLAQALGLHRRTTRVMDPITREQRNRLFWASYVMANSIAMLVGRPSPIQDFDCDVDFPLDVADEQITAEGIIQTNTHRPFNFFLNEVRLSKLCSRAYHRLYSAQALASHTWDSLADAIGELDSELIAWRDAIPIEFRPEHDIAWHENATYRQVMLMHLSYYNCMYTLHRPIFTLALRSGSSFAPDKPVKELRNARVYGSAAVCVGAARSGLRLLLDVAQRYPGIVRTKCWLVVYYPFNSIIALFASIMGNPQQLSAQGDLELISSARRFFSTLTETFEVAQKLLELAENFENAATTALGPESRKRPRDSSPAATLEHHLSYTNGNVAGAEAVTEWFAGGAEFYDQSGAEFQNHLMQSSDLWMAPSSFDWDDWVENIGRMPIPDPRVSSL